MTDQGEDMIPIEEFVDASFAEDWYRRDGVPSALLRDAGGVVPALQWSDFAEPLEDDVFQAMLRESLERAHNTNAPAHGHAHATRNVSYLDEALDALERILQVTLPKRFRQIILLAMARHDWEHPAATFMELLSPKARQSRSLPTVLLRRLEEYSVEYLTSIWADQASRDDGLTVADRLLQLYVIWSTTNPTKPERMQKLGIAEVKPTRMVGLLSQAVDVTPTADDTTNVRFEAGLFCHELFPEEAPESVEDYVRSRRRFAEIVSGRYNAVDAAMYELVALYTGAIESIVRLTGWHRGLERIERFLERLEKRDPVAVSTLTSSFGIAGHDMAA